MDKLLQGYADAWADRPERNHQDEELRSRYERGYNEGLRDLKKSRMFNRSTVNSLQVRGEREQVGARPGRKVKVK